MKTIATLILAATAFLAPAGRACDDGDAPVRITTCQPVFIGTRQIASRIECRSFMDSCGRRFTREVRVLTLANIFSDGSRQVFTRTVRL